MTTPMIKNFPPLSPAYPSKRQASTQSRILLPHDMRRRNVDQPAVCVPPVRALPSMFTEQVATGIETPASLRLKGIDEPLWMPKPLFRNMYQMDNVNAEAAGGFCDFQAPLAPTTSLAEAGAVVANTLTQKLAMALSTLKADIDPAKPMHVYGVDSLVAVEIRNWLA